MYKIGSDCSLTKSLQALEVMSLSDESLKTKVTVGGDTIKTTGAMVL